MLNLSILYLWLLWLTPAAIYFGAPSGLSLAIFFLPVLVCILKFNQITRSIFFLQLIFFAGVIIISSVNSNVSIANILIFLSLTLQFPLGLFLTSFLSAEDVIRLVRHLNFVCAVQVVFALIEIFIWQRPGDSINGTMFGDYHGTHIMPFILFIALLVNWKKRNLNIKILIFYLAISIYISIKADAKLVLLAIALYGLLVFSFKVVRTGENTLFKLGAIPVFVILFFVLINSGIIDYANQRWSYEIANSLSSKNKILNQYFDASSDYRIENSILVGAGPTQTVSRSAIIAQSQSRITNQPSLLEVSRPKYYAKFIETTGKFNIGPISSISQPISSIVGILGDIGILGAFLFFAILIVSLFKSIGHANLAAEIFAIFVVYLIPLSYFNTFLEFPQATFPLVIAIRALSLIPRIK